MGSFPCPARDGHAGARVEEVEIPRMEAGLTVH